MFALCTYVYKMGPKENCTEVEMLLLLGQTEQHSIMVTLIVAYVVLADSSRYGLHLGFKTNLSSACWD